MLLYLFVVVAFATLLAVSLPSIIDVQNYEDLYANYAGLLRAPTPETVFRVASSGTFLAPANELQPVKLDAVHLRGRVWNALWKHDDDWVEFAYNGTQRTEYPGFIPASPCQSHEYGDGGSVGFSYSYGQEEKIGSMFGVSWVIGDVTLLAAAGSFLSSSTTISGSVSCSIGKGKVGQVLLRPTFIRTTPLSRRVRYLRLIRQFLFNDDFEQQDEIQRLLLLGAYRIACATSDVVPLFCDSRRFGTDWDNPLGADYDL